MIALLISIKVTLNVTLKSKLIGVARWLILADYFEL